MQVRWSLMAVGTHGSLEVARGGWTGSRAQYTLTWQGADDAAPSSMQLGFSGVDTEFKEFLFLVRWGVQKCHPCLLRIGLGLGLSLAKGLHTA